MCAAEVFARVIPSKESNEASLLLLTFLRLSTTTAKTTRRTYGNSIRWGDTNPFIVLLEELNWCKK